VILPVSITFFQRAYSCAWYAANWAGRVRDDLEPEIGELLL
jgi:hypothetical protein